MIDNFFIIISVLNFIIAFLNFCALPFMVKKEFRENENREKYQKINGVSSLLMGAAWLMVGLYGKYDSFFNNYIYVTSIMIIVVISITIAVRNKKENNM